MTGLEGTVNTPLGTVQKKYAVLGGVILVGVLGIAWYRSKKSASAAATAAAGQSVGIDPATGYIYGSAEDAAALGNQSQYQYPSPSYGSGSGGTASAGYQQGFVSNAAWTQAVIAYMSGNGLVADTTQLTSALGKYVTGSPATPTDVALINQAIAIEGQPPVAGPNGFPPSINTANTGSNPPASDPYASSPYEEIRTGKVAVKAKDSVVNTVRSLQGHGWTGTYDTLKALNPDMARNIHTDANHAAHPEWDYFISSATYRLR